MDTESLAQVLASASLSEYVEPLSPYLTQINGLGPTGDKKALLELLKSAGCTKMGVRQKLATVLMCELSSASRQVEEEPAIGGDFWGSMIQQSEALGGDSSIFGELPPAVSAAADAKLLAEPKAPPVAAAVAPLPPELIAAKLEAAAPDVSIVAEARALALAATDAQSTPVEVSDAEAPPTVTGGTAAPAPAPAPIVAPPPMPAAEPEPPSSAAEEQANLFRKLGDEAMSRKDRAGAERWFVQALAATPSNQALLFRLSSCALAASPPDHARALHYLGRILALPPPHGDARLQMAKSSLELGQVEASVAHYDAALSEAGVSPESSEVMEYLEKPSTPSESRAASAKSGLSEVAKRAADGRVEAAYVLTQLQRAKQMTLEGRTLEAQQAARVVRQHCNACCLGTKLAVDALERKGRLAEAVETAKEGVEKAMHDIESRVIWARLLSRKGSPAQAEAELTNMVEAAKKLAPEDRKPGHDRAEAALAGFLAAKKLKDDGNKAYGASQFERAITAYTKALEADPEGFFAPTLHGNRSQASVKLGQLSNALDDCNKAVAIDDEAIKMRLRRAACRLELNQPDEAVGDYERILELDPENAAAISGMERAEEVASGSDGRKGGLIDFEGERLDPYEVLDVPKDCNAIQIKAAFRKLALLWHPDKHEGEDDAAKAYAVSQFKRIRIAHQVLSDPNERSRLDEEGMLTKGKGEEGRIKPFHEYYSINTPEGYTRGGCFVSTRRYDPMVGAVDARGSLNAGEKMSRKMIAQHEEAIRLKGPEEAKRLLAPGESPNSQDAYTKYWDRQEELRVQRGKNKNDMKEDKANNQSFFGKRDYQPKPVAQTRYLPLEVEHRDSVQKDLIKGAVGPMKKLGHRDD